MTRRRHTYAREMRETRERALRNELTKFHVRHAPLNPIVTGIRRAQGRTR